MDERRELIGVGIESYEKDYIVAVLEYMDKYMGVSINETANFEAQHDKMLEICRRIKQHKTGIAAIDQIVKYRRDALLNSGFLREEDIKNVPENPHVDNYIAALSPNGGLFDYVSKKRTEYTEKPYLEEPEPLVSAEEPKKDEDVRADLLKGIDDMDFNPYERDYIRAVVDYIDNQMVLEANERDPFVSKFEKMKNVIKTIEEGKTGIPEIDQVKARRIESEQSLGVPMPEAFIKKLPPVDPAVKSCIASILNNGGLYSLVNESISHEKVRDDKNQEGYDIGEL